MQMLDAALMFRNADISHEHDACADAHVLAAGDPQPPLVSFIHILMHFVKWHLLANDLGGRRAEEEAS